MVRAQTHVHPERHQFGMLAHRHVAITVVQRRGGAAHQGGLAFHEERHLLRLKPSRVHQDHVLVEHTQRFEPLDLGLARSGYAGIVRLIAEARMRLQLHLMPVRQILESGDELIARVVHAAKRGREGEPPMVLSEITLKEGFGLLETRPGGFDHAGGQQPHDRTRLVKT